MKRKFLALLLLATGLPCLIAATWTTDFEIVKLFNNATDGQLFIGKTGYPMQVATLTAGSGVSITNGAGAITIASSSTYPSDAGDGTITIGRNSGASALATITGTSNQVTVTNGTNSITLSTPQNTHTSATPQFARMGLGAAADATHIIKATTASTTNNSEVVDVTHTGNISGTGYGVKVSVTGTSTTNIAVDATATGATTNYAIQATGTTYLNGSEKHKTCTIADGDATPSVLGCTILTTSANTGATEITDLDDPVVGSIVYLVGGSATNSSTITDGGNFNLSAGWTAALDDVLILYVQADNDYLELGRVNN